MSLHNFSDKEKESLEYFAKYIWWETPQYLVENEPFKILAFAIRYANEESEYLKFRDSFNDDILKEALKKAQAGWIDGKSWNFWHIILYGTDCKIPPLPQREIICN